MTRLEHFIEYISKKNFDGVEVKKIKKGISSIIVRLGLTYKTPTKYSIYTVQEAERIEKAAADIEKIASTYYSLKLNLTIKPKFDHYGDDMPF